MFLVIAVPHKQSHAAALLPKAHPDSTASTGPVLWLTPWCIQQLFNHSMVNYTISTHAGD